MHDHQQALIQLSVQLGGIPIPALMTEEFRSSADRLFGFNGSERQPYTKSGWLTRANADALSDFCQQVATAYAAELERMSGERRGAVRDLVRESQDLGTYDAPVDSYPASLAEARSGLA